MCTVLVALVLLLLPHWNVRASPDELAVAALIDTSGSMRVTDPDNLRAEAVRLLFSLLPDDSRLALITFDTDTRILRKPDRVGSDRKALLPLLLGITSHGRDTNLEDPLRVAYQLLRATPASERMIVLLTDGKMDLGDPALDRAANERLAGELLPALAREGIRVHTIAFSHLSDVAAMQETALVTRGFFQLADRPEKIHLAFANLFNRASEVHTIPLQGSRFFVDRWVNELTIVATRRTGGAGVRVILPDKTAQVLERHPAGWKWYPSQAFEMITIPRPSVGTWEIEYGAEQGNSVFILTDLRLLVSLEREVVHPGEEMQVLAWLEQGETGRVVPPPALSETRMTGEVTCPDGTRTWFPFLDGPGQEHGSGHLVVGVFQGVFKPCGPGQHDIKVTCKAMTFEREKRIQVHVVDKSRLATLPAVPPGPATRNPLKERDPAASVKSAKAPGDPDIQGPSGARWPWFLLVLPGILLGLSCGWVARSRYAGRLQPAGQAPSPAGAPPRQGPESDQPPDDAATAPEEDPTLFQDPAEEGAAPDGQVPEKERAPTPEEEDPTLFQDPAEEGAAPDGQIPEKEPAPTPEEDPARVQDAAEEAATTDPPPPKQEPDPAGDTGPVDGSREMEEIVKALEDVLYDARQQEKWIRQELDEMSSKGAGVKEHAGLVRTCLESFGKYTRELEDSKRDIFLCYETQRVCSGELEEKFSKLQDAFDLLKQEKEALLKAAASPDPEVPSPGETPPERSDDPTSTEEAEPRGARSGEETAAASPVSGAAAPAGGATEPETPETRPKWEGADPLVAPGAGSADPGSDRPEPGKPDPGPVEPGDPGLAELQEEMQKTEDAYMALYTEYSSVHESTRAPGAPDPDPETLQRIQEMEAELERMTARMDEIGRTLQSLESS